MGLFVAIAHAHDDRDPRNRIGCFERLINVIGMSSFECCSILPRESSCVLIPIGSPARYARPILIEPNFRRDQLTKASPDRMRTPPIAAIPRIREFLDGDAVSAIQC